MSFSIDHKYNTKGEEIKTTKEENGYVTLSSFKVECSRHFNAKSDAHKFKSQLFRK